MMASRGPDAHEAMGTIYSEDAAIFFLELMLRVVLQNRLGLPKLVYLMIYILVLVYNTDFTFNLSNGFALSFQR